MEIGVIKEFVRVREEMMIYEPNGDEYIMIRGECFPVLRLGEWYGMSPDKYVKSVEDGMMLIIEIEDKKIWLYTAWRWKHSLDSGPCRIDVAS